MIPQREIEAMVKCAETALETPPAIMETVVITDSPVFCPNIRKKRFVQPFRKV